MQRRELWIGLYVAFLWNLVVAAVLNNPIQPSKHTWFVVVGAANELLGVLMIASPELLPIVAAALVYAGRRLRILVLALTRRLRQLLRVATTHYARGTASIGATASIQAKVTRAPLTTLPDVIAWVKRHDQELQEHRKRLTDIPDEWRQDIARQAEETEDLVRRLILGLANRNLGLRLLGVGFVVLGMLLSTTGNSSSAGG